MMSDTRMSFPYKSADGLTTYVTMGDGSRRRVEVIDGRVEFVKRVRKSERKAAKKLRRKII